MYYYGEVWRLPNPCETTRTAKTEQLKTVRGLKHLYLWDWLIVEVGTCASPRLLTARQHLLPYIDKVERTAERRPLRHAFGTLDPETKRVSHHTAATHRKR